MICVRGVGERWGLLFLGISASSFDRGRGWGPQTRGGPLSSPFLPVRTGPDPSEDGTTEVSDVELESRTDKRDRCLTLRRKDWDFNVGRKFK